MTQPTVFRSGKPEAVGVYRTKRAKATRALYTLWDGARWHWDEIDPKAARAARFVSNYQTRTWAPIECAAR